jgi:hypothetical protein
MARRRLNLTWHAEVASSLSESFRLSLMIGRSVIVIDLESMIES